MPMSQFIARIQKEDERCFNLVTRHAFSRHSKPMLRFRNELNPASNIRGRPSTVSQREQNLRELVAIYNELPVEQRGESRLLHLLKVQYHLSPTAFTRVEQEKHDEDENGTPSASQGSNAGMGSSQGSNAVENDSPSCSQTDIFAVSYSQGSTVACASASTSSGPQPGRNIHSWANGTFAAFSFDVDN